MAPAFDAFHSVLSARVRSVGHVPGQVKSAQVKSSQLKSSHVPYEEEVERGEDADGEGGAGVRRAEQQQIEGEDKHRREGDGAHLQPMACTRR